MKQTITVNGQTPLGELVTYFPPDTSRLNEFHIDYCCQGDRTLEAAIKPKLTMDFITEIQDAKLYLLLKATVYHVATVVHYRMMTKMG